MYRNMITIHNLLLFNDILQPLPRLVYLLLGSSLSGLLNLVFYIKCILRFLFSNKLWNRPLSSAALMIFNSNIVQAESTTYSIIYNWTLACERGVAEMEIVPWPALVEFLTHSSNYALKPPFGSMLKSRNYPQVHSLQRKTS